MIKCQDCGKRIHQQDVCTCEECVNKIKNPPVKKKIKKKVVKKG